MSERVAVYEQMQAELRALIDSGEFGEGDQFLSERQVTERWGVSRPTANKVLSGMVAAGLLEFRKGIGSFVRRPPLDYDVRRLESFTAKAKQAGRKPMTQVLEFERVEADGEIAGKLGLAVGEAVYVVGRLRLADGVPVILERRWLPAGMLPGLTRKDLRGSLYDLLRERYGLEISESDQTIRAVGIKGAEAKLLGVSVGTAGLLVSATGYAGEKELWWERTLYRGDEYEFHHHRAAPGRLIAKGKGGAKAGRG